MNETLRAAIAALRADTTSGASELLPRAVAVLRQATAHGREALVQAAREVCRSQPSMGSFWNAAAAALASSAESPRLERFEQRWRRGGEALTRVAAESLRPETGRTLHVTTVSFSGSVLAVLRALAKDADLTVAAAEGRPMLEGRRLAAALGDAGIAVDFYTDAAIGLALDRTDAVLVGADAVGPGWFLNKCGTGPLAAAASLAGVPVFVAATRDKCLPPALAALLRVEPRAAAEVWPDAPVGVSVHNHYFERVPLDQVAALLTDAGLVGVDAAEELCRANADGVTPEIVRELRIEN